MEETKQKITHPVKRILILFVGLIFMAFGVAFSIKSNLGTSPISSIPYVLNLITGLSVGTMTMIVNFLFVVFQIILLRKRYEWFQFLQFVVATIFGFIIDLAQIIIKDITVPNYFMQWVYCLLGILILSIGIAFEVMANFVPSAGEGTVLAICKVTNIKFGYMKMIFDLSLVVIAVILSFIFLGGLNGVREGTIAAALFVGLLNKLFSKETKKLGAIIFA